jgi:hypothetical protein
MAIQIVSAVSPHLQIVLTLTPLHPLSHQLRLLRAQSWIAGTIDELISSCYILTLLIPRSVDKYDGEINMLRQQITYLTNSLKDLTEKVSRTVSSPGETRNSHTYSTTTSSRFGEPKEPLFIGHTRSAFSLNIAKSSLTQRGMRTDTTVPTSAASSVATSPRDLTPELGDSYTIAGTESAVLDPILSIPLAEVIRLVDVFQEEIELVYPFISSETLAAEAPQLIEHLRSSLNDPNAASIEPDTETDIRLLKVAIASAIVVEAHGRNALGERLFKSVTIDRTADVSLKDVQVMTMSVSRSPDLSRHQINIHIIYRAYTIFMATKNYWLGEQ